MKRSLWVTTAFCSLLFFGSCGSNQNNSQDATMHEGDSSYVPADTPSNAHILPPPAGGVTDTTKN